MFNKATGTSFVSSILNAGSENDFNTVVDAKGRLNFEALFQDVDSASARTIARIVEHRSLGWMTIKDRATLADLGAVQLLRTKLARATSGVLAEEMRDALLLFGADPEDPFYRLPDEADAKIGTIRAFLDRSGHRDAFHRLAPGLVEPAGSGRFLISDHPIVSSNPFPYGDLGLRSQGVMVHLPLSPTLLLTWHCPTIAARLAAVADGEAFASASLAAYANALVAGTPAPVSDEEVERYNGLQASQSALFLYAHEAEFDGVRATSTAKPRKSLMHLGEMGRGPPPRRGMPAGWNLVVHGQADHCLLNLAEIDEKGEGVTARTTDLGLLEAVSKDPRLSYVELYDVPQQQRHMGQVKIEQLASRGPGWFRAVHADEALRALDRHLASEKEEGKAGKDD